MLLFLGSGCVGASLGEFSSRNVVSLLIRYLDPCARRTLRVACTVARDSGLVFDDFPPTFTEKSRGIDVPLPADREQVLVQLREWQDSTVSFHRRGFDVLPRERGKRLLVRGFAQKILLETARSSCSHFHRATPALHRIGGATLGNAFVHVSSAIDSDASGSS